MNVCLFADSFLPKIGGMELAIHYLGNALTDIGCRVTVIAKKYNGDKKHPHKYNLITYGNRFPGSGRSGYDFITGVGALVIENYKRNFDVVNCHSISYAAKRATFANKLIKKPLILTPHGDDLFCVPEINLGLRLNKRWDNIIIKNLASAHAVTAISKSFQKELEFLPKNIVHVIPNGIDIAKLPVARNTYLHDLLHLDPPKKIVLSVGRNCKQKAFDMGIKTFSVLKGFNECDDLVYVIIGRDTHLLKPLVDKYSLGRRVFLISEQDHRNTLKCFQSSWCFFSSSVIEGLSLVSIEAMASGLPLVMTDVPGNDEIVLDNKCGILIKSGDPRAMAEGLRALRTNNNLYISFRNSALNSAGAYDWLEIAKKYLNVYNMTINRYLN